MFSKQISLLFLALGILSCKEKSKPDKKIILTATDKFRFIDSTKLTFNIFSDSSFIFNVNVKGEDYDRNENFRGKVKIESDTLSFSPRFEFARADTAVLKNGWVEFINKREPFRIRIQKTELKVRKNIDLSKLKNYAVFSYVDRSEGNKNYDLSEKDLNQIEILLKTEFKKKSGLKNYDSYLKQIIGYEKKSGEKFTIVKCFCGDEDRRKTYEKNVIEMSDGGICNLYIIINLTKNKIELFNNGGLA